jgi:phytoene desaturase
MGETPMRPVKTMLEDPRVAQKKAIVIGAGLGGIAAALRLRKRGYAVTLLDKQSQLGGRATVCRRNGYTFDAGPTVVTAHFLFDELFELFGKKREDYITFVPLYPWYRIRFADGSHFDYGGTLEQTLAEIRKIHPPDCKRKKSSTSASPISAISRSTRSGPCSAARRN